MRNIKLHFIINILLYCNIYLFIIITIIVRLNSYALCLKYITEIFYTIKSPMSYNYIHIF